MDLRFEGISACIFRQRYRIINILLIAAAVMLALWSLSIWGRSIALPAPEEPMPKPELKRNTRNKVISASSYNVVVDKDLFRPARQKYVKPRPRPVPPPPPPSPPPRRPPPKLILIGTVLLDDGEAAIMDYAGQKGGIYRVGDSIEEFVVKDIRKDSVSLERDGEVLKVAMSPAAAKDRQNEESAWAHPAPQASPGPQKPSTPQEAGSGMLPAPPRIPGR